MNNQLKTALRKLVERCDGPEGVRADGSNIDTLEAHAVLGDFDKDKNCTECGLELFKDETGQLFCSKCGLEYD